MSKTVVKLIKEGDDVTVEINGKCGEVVALLSQGLIDVASSDERRKEMVANACKIIMRKIND